MSHEPVPWDRVKGVFEAALDRPPGERSAFLNDVCGSNHALRQEVESLLRADAGAADFAARPAIEVLAPSNTPVSESRRMSAEAAIPPGARLGPYELVAHIGRGGMGDVYRARDTRLGRIVAVKVLLPHVASDAELKQRFEREARTLAALTHPHICAVFDVGHQAPAAGSDQGVDYLVMEYLEGETLAARLARGPLPLDEALQHATQIAAALETAHQMGVIHRDLKPGNIMLTAGGTKVLDFGLAKALGGDAPSPDLTQTPARSVTREGWLLGTPAYMSPEQARGKAVDRRADLWAFGCVLFEMLTGKRTFQGDDVTETIAAVVREEPDWSALPATTPAAIRRLLRRTLAKDPRGRLPDAATARLEIEDASTMHEDGPTSDAGGFRQAPRRSEHVAWTLVAALAMAVAALSIPTVRYLRGPAPAEPVRFLIDTPQSTNSFQVSLSPDGRMIAYVARAESGKPMLYVRPIDSLSAKPLPGTEDAWEVFWSPDSRSLGVQIGYGPNFTLKRVDALGGSLQTIAACGTGSWSPDGVIVCSNGEVLARVPATGGALTRITRLDASRQETGHFYPQFLPDGRHFLYVAWSSKPENRAVYVGALDSDQKTRIMPAESKTVYAPPGFLLFLRQGTLVAQAFDASRLALTGEPIPVVEGVPSSGIAGNFAVAASSTGTLVYRGNSTEIRQLAWFDRQGRRLAEVGPAGAYAGFALSPDEKRVAIARREPGEPGEGFGSLWTLELSTGVFSRLTTDVVGEPTWAPDSRTVLFASARAGDIAAFSRTLDTREDVQMFASPEGSQWPDDWSRDGRFILINDRNRGIRALPTTGDRKPIRLMLSDTVVDESQFFPDGRWVAYVSTEPGQAEVFVTPFPDFTYHRQVSTGGGNAPRWRRDGKELFYMTGDGQLMAVEVKVSDTTLDTTAPTKLFATGVTAGTPGGNTFSVSGDGNRFLVLGRDSRSTPISVILNWTSLLK
jgi:serine/threonine protein kinase